MSDEKYRKFHSGLCPNTKNILGVRVPVLRDLAKKIINDDWENYLNNDDDEYYEEVLLQGMIIGIAKMDIQRRLKFIENFVPKIDNWAICDVFCAGLKFAKLKSNKNVVFEFVKKYFKSNNEFELRFAIVMLLDFYVTEDYLDQVFQIINDVKHEGYYVKMAMAWLISIAYIRSKDKTINYLKNNHLDTFTYNKALQKIVESNRVSDDDKLVIKSMKR